MHRAIHTSRTTSAHCTCLLTFFSKPPRELRPVARTFFTSSASSSSTYTKPISSQPPSRSLKPEHSATDIRPINNDKSPEKIPRLVLPKKYRPHVKKLLERKKQRETEDTSGIHTLLHNLTTLSPKEFNAVFEGPRGHQRLANFMRLHVALKNEKDPESMWMAYEETRKVQDDLLLLSPEILRMLIIHFKEATSPTFFPSSTSTTATTESLPLDKTSRLTRKIQDTLWAERILTVLEDKRLFNLEISRWDLSDMMSALNRLGRYSDSLREFNRYLSDQTAKLDPILLSHAVRAWVGRDRLDVALARTKDLAVKYKVTPSEFTLAYLIQETMLKDRKTEAFSLWQQLVASRSVDEVQTLNGILRVCVKVRASDFAQIIYDSMKSFGVEPNDESLKLMLSLAVSEINYTEERDGFLKTISDKIASKSETDKVFDKPVLDSILVNFSKKGDTESAVLVFQLMRQHGFASSTQEHNEILHCFVRWNQMDKAMDWIQYMRQSGLRPDRASYVLLMQAYTRLRMPRETEAIFRQLITDGVQPDLALCNYLLLAYEQARMSRRCLQLYKNMFRERSIGVDVFSFSCMFNAVFHSEKADLEGGEGLRGSGSLLGFNTFIGKLSHPISSPLISTASTTFDPPTTSYADIQESLYPTTPPVKYLFDDAVSTTEDLNPRSLFRDMVLVGIRPSRSLYGNILRAFLSKHDYAGTTVATKACLDFYAFRPTPKMVGIVLSWVVKEMERRGPSLKENALSSRELAKVVHMMGRPRGLVEILQKIVEVEQWGPDVEKAKHKKQEDDAYEEKFMNKDELRLRHQHSRKQEQPLDPIAEAKQEMGGDLIDLYTRGPLTAYSWSTAADEPIRLDLTDFERWFSAYSKRTTFAQAHAASIENKKPSWEE
ncbi:hypothetical protein BGZ83_010181 [Gryganskiella cystojenkinii]|nr:hypothetical protein BGZ83_010181 [Gryganskiella cystojenkinii]